MKKLILARYIPIILSAFILSSFAQTTFAASGDYEFSVVSPETLTVKDEIVSVQLLNKKTGKPVTDAIIFAKRIDMAPDGMENMIMPIEEQASSHDGIYRFKTQLVMAGNWRLSLAAKVQNEQDTVESKLIFKVVP